MSPNLLAGVHATCRAPPEHSFGSKSHPRFFTVSEAFLHHATVRPGAIAARDLSSAIRGPREITYGELALKSAKLACRLRQKGVGPGNRVPLVAKRGIDMLVGIMAILACGAQYVPLDGGVVPDSTLRFVAEQAGGSSCIAVALKSTRQRLDACNVAGVLCIDDSGEHEDACVLDLNLAEPEGGCYVIYTSGECP